MDVEEKFLRDFKNWGPILLGILLKGNSPKANFLGRNLLVKLIPTLPIYSSNSN